MLLQQNKNSLQVHTSSYFMVACLSIHIVKYQLLKVPCFILIILKKGMRNPETLPKVISMTEAKQKRKEGEKCSASSKRGWGKPSGLGVRSRKCVTKLATKASWKLKFHCLDAAAVMFGGFYPELRWKSKITTLFSLSKVQKTIKNTHFFWPICH